DNADRLKVTMAQQATRKKQTPGLIAQNGIAAPIAERAIKSLVIHLLHYYDVSASSLLRGAHLINRFQLIT
ncbi:MAG: hypothetical protein E7H57_11940, partial [Pantoea sp.]|nr:hypothetical protein [Pantoea sp.]